MTILASDHLTFTRRNRETSPARPAVSKNSQLFSNLQLFQDRPNVSWLLSHDHSGERPASSRTEAWSDKPGFKASSLQDVSDIYVDFRTLQVFVAVLLLVVFVEQCQSFSELSSFAQSDRRLLSYDHLSECPPCLHQERGIRHQETSWASLAVSKTFQTYAFV